MYKLRNNYFTLIKEDFNEKLYKTLMKANMGVSNYVNNDMNLDQNGFESKP